MFNVVLYEPEIPANTGNIGRTCVVAGARLHLIKPLGFSLDERALRRAGLGYWPNLNVTVHDSWNDFTSHCGLAAAGPEPRLHFLTKKARRTYAEATYRGGDYLVLGKESSGLPEELLARYATSCERIPMLPDERSLANREAWAHHADELAAAAGANAGEKGGSASPLKSGADDAAARPNGNAPTADDARGGTVGASGVTSANAADTSPHAALKRQDICGNFIDPEDYRISALNLSNAAAIVLYEALRQTGFAGM